MSFEQRLSKSRLATKRFEEWCQSNNIEYAHTGHECLKQTNNFSKNIYGVRNTTTSITRYFPDYSVANNYSSLVEVKFGKSIERDAYNMYMSIDKITPVYIAFYDYVDDILQVTRIDELKFNIPKVEWTVYDKYWISPRNSDYEKWKSLHPKGSGTDYAFVNFKNTNFKRLV